MTDTEDRSRTHWQGCHTAHLDCAILRVVTLEAAIERLREDAERYRWLRKRHENTIMYVYSTIPAMTSPELLDAAIDAAMEKNT